MKPKVLITASTYSHIRNFHLPYLREFQHLGWETHVGCNGIPSDTLYIDKVIELPFEKRMQSPANFRVSNILRERIRAEQYDLIITHTSLAAFFTRLAVKGMRERPKLINVVHGYLFDDDTPVFRRKLLLTAERLTAPETDLLLTMNEWDDQAAKKYRLGMRVEKIPGMGVDFSNLDRATPEDGAHLRKKLGLSSEQFVLLYAAEFSERKSQHVLIEAMACLSENVVLLLPGNGALWQECRALAQRLGLERRVIFPGQIADMGAWYRLADAAVSSSRSEGLPFNVMEAMHMELPVIASAVKGHVDLIDDGETGLLYPYGDADACAAQVLRLMDGGTLRDRMRIQGRESVEKYKQDAVLPQVMQHYLNAIEYVPHLWGIRG